MSIECMWKERRGMNKCNIIAKSSKWLKCHNKKKKLLILREIEQDKRRKIKKEISKKYYRILKIRGYITIKKSLNKNQF